MSITNFVHDIAVSHDPQSSTPGQIDHMSYWLDDSRELLQAADILSEDGIEFEGPEKHGISQAMYIYVVDPVSGMCGELFIGSYLIFEPDWESIEWPLKDMDVGFYSLGLKNRIISWKIIQRF